MAEIIIADSEEISRIAPLLDAYRVFYGKTSDVDLAIAFLTERFAQKQSIVFLAIKNGTAAGFAQLYTSYSTVSLKPIFILNDLYVRTDSRGNGLGKALLEKCKEFCRTSGYNGLALETASDNPAQHLYEKLGWKRDTASFHYFWTCE